MSEEIEEGPRVLDRHLIAVAVLSVLATVTVAGAISLIAVHAEGGRPDIAAVNGASILGALMVVVALTLALDYSRRRWIAKRCAALAATQARAIEAFATSHVEAIEELRTMAHHAHAETIGTLVTVGSEIGVLREMAAEHLGALVGEVEQLSAKVGEAYWRGYTAGVDDMQKGGAVVQPLRRDSVTRPVTNLES